MCKFQIFLHKLANSVLSQIFEVHSYTERVRETKKDKRNFKQELEGRVPNSIMAASRGGSQEKQALGLGVQERRVMVKHVFSLGHVQRTKS